MIELDHNATTQPDPAVIEAMVRSMRDAWHNPASIHRAGQAARRDMELARQACADLIGAEAKEITFCSGGTEAIDLALRGALDALPEARRVLVTTRVEHAAVRDLALELERRGLARVRWAPVDREGLVRLDELASLLDGACGVLSLQWANNETGAIQPIERAAALACSRGWLVHSDATQWVGKMPTSVRSSKQPEPWLDLLTYAPHKLHGPKGVGVLWTRRGVALRSRLMGAHEAGRRGGTPNVPGIVGAGEAARIAQAWLAGPEAREELARRRDTFEQAILARVRGAAVNGPSAPGARLWNTSNIALPGLEAEAVLLALSERGVNASAGAACSSGSLEPSPVLLAMGVPEALAHGSLRFSIGKHTTADELARAAEVVIEVARMMGCG